MGKNVVLPEEFLNSWMRFYNAWDDSDFVGKCPEMDDEMELMFQILGKKVDAMKRRKEYILSGGQFKK